MNKKNDAPLGEGIKFLMPARMHLQESGTDQTHHNLPRPPGGNVHHSGKFLEGYPSVFGQVPQEPLLFRAQLNKASIDRNRTVQGVDHGFTGQKGFITHPYVYPPFVVVAQGINRLFTGRRYRYRQQDFPSNLDACALDVEGGPAKERGGRLHHVLFLLYFNTTEAAVVANPYKYASSPRIGKGTQGSGNFLGTADGFLEILLFVFTLVDPLEEPGR